MRVCVGSLGDQWAEDPDMFQYRPVIIWGGALHGKEFFFFPRDPYSIDIASCLASFVNRWWHCQSRALFLGIFTLQLMIERFLSNVDFFVLFPLALPWRDEDFFSLKIFSRLSCPSTNLDCCAQGNIPLHISLVLYDDHLLCTSPRQDFLYIGLSLTKNINHLITWKLLYLRFFLSCSERQWFWLIV